MLYRKDMRTGALQQIGDKNDHGLQISQDGRFVLYRNDSSLYLHDVQTAKSIQVDRNADGSSHPLGLLSDSGYSLSDNGQLVSYVDTYGLLQVKNLLDCSLQAIGKPGYNGYFAFNVKLSGDGQHISYADEKGLLHDYDLSARADHVLGQHARPLAFSADGNLIATLLVPRDVYQYPAPPMLQQSDMALLDLRQDGVANAHNNLFSAIDGQANTMAGLGGDDQYWVDHKNDLVQENPDAGNDTVYSLLRSYTLPQNVEKLVMAWNSNLSLPTDGVQNGSGNALDNWLVGNLLDNTLRGMDGNDTLVGGDGGNDVLDGGNGYDVVLYTLRPASETRIQINPENQLVNLSSDGGITRTQVSNVERIQFATSCLSFTGDTQAADSYRLYQAAFNRTPDSSGLGFWVIQREHGASQEQIANAFMQSDEFKSQYGNQPTHTELTSHFYQNVLHRAPDAGGLQYWVDLLDSGQASPAQVLASFADSAENKAALTGVLQAGFWFDHMA